MEARSQGTRQASSVIRLRITSWWDLGCSRVVELPDRSSLYELHQVIQREFELEDDHLWAFFLSGEYFDPDTEFGVGEKARPPHVQLSELGLTAGMKIAYVFDFGDELRHDVLVESVERVTEPLRGPWVVERVGKPPPQYPVLDDEDRPVQEVSPRAPVAEGLLADVEALMGLLGEGEELEDKLGPARRARALDLIGRVLDGCPTRDVMGQASEAAGTDVEAMLEDALGVVRAEENSTALEELEWRFARIPQGHDHGQGFDAGLLAEVRWALLRYSQDDRTCGDRVAGIPRERLQQICDGILEVCPERGRFLRLTACLHDVNVTSLLLDRVDVVSPGMDEASLASLLERTARAVGPVSPHVMAANALSEAGQRARAREVLALADRDVDQLELGHQAQVAHAHVAAESPGRAEAIYRRVLEHRWVSRKVRSDAVAGLGKALRDQGRADDARRLVQREEARRREVDARRAGTVVRSGAKVGRNDPCSCGSGKKAKKCCGAAG